MNLYETIYVFLDLNRKFPISHIMATVQAGRVSLLKSYFINISSSTLLLLTDISFIGKVSPIHYTSVTVRKDVTLPIIVREGQNKVNYFPSFVCLKLSNSKQTKT